MQPNFLALLFLTITTTFCAHSTDLAAKKTRVNFLNNSGDTVSFGIFDAIKRLDERTLAHKDSAELTFTGYLETGRYVRIAGQKSWLRTNLTDLGDGCLTFEKHTDRFIPLTVSPGLECFIRERSKSSPIAFDFATASASTLSAGPTPAPCTIFDIGPSNSVFKPGTLSSALASRAASRRSSAAPSPAGSPSRPYSSTGVATTPRKSPADRLKEASAKLRDLALEE